VAKPNEDRLSPYLMGVMALLFVATFLEGYDFFIVSLIQDKLSHDFHISLKKVLTGVAVMNIGALFGFFVVRLADRLGRKPIFIFAITGCGVFSIATAFSPNFYTYVANQFMTKLFLVTEFNMAVLIISETFPSRIRATAVGVLEMAGGIGGMAAAIVGKFALPLWGWRCMYMIGGLPLILAPVVFLFLKETRYFIELSAAPREYRQPLWHIWTTPSKKRVLLVGAIWFLCYLCYAGMIYHWVLFAKTERGWSDAQIGVPMSIATILGMTGYVICGVVMDAIGRRAAGVLFFLGAAGALLFAFSARGQLMLPGLILGIFFVFSLLPVCSTYNAELFPTELRAQASAWSNFILGRPAQVAAPYIVAVLIAPLGGVGAAVKLLAVGPVIAAFMILFLFPETKGTKMDKIH